MITPVRDSVMSAILIYDQSNCDKLRHSNTADYITDDDNSPYALITGFH